MPSTSPPDPIDPPEGQPSAPERPGAVVLVREVRLAALVVLAQAAGLLVGALALFVEIVRGGYDDAGRAWSDAAFALLGAAALVFAARGLSYLRAAVRTPLIVFEVLALPIGYSLGAGSGRWGYAIPILISAVAILALLATAPARAALDRR